MYLQPIATADGGIVGAEALVRWITEDGTMIMPGAFIETLEQAGLIHKLDAYIWELAVKQLQSWKNTDLKNMFISVNLSPRDFYSTDVYRTLTGLLEKYDAESWKLWLELTETALITEQGECEKVIEALRDRGFIIEIDDFGTGYSSLSLLKNIRADVLKIDRSFLQEIEGNEHHSKILAGVISLAKSLGLGIISEGVETKQQLDTLSAMECRYFQGFYFSRPLPAEEFEALARTGITGNDKTMEA